HGARSDRGAPPRPAPRRPAPRRERDRWPKPPFPARVCRRNRRPAPVRQEWLRVDENIGPLLSLPANCLPGLQSPNSLGFLRVALTPTAPSRRVANPLAESGGWRRDRWFRIVVHPRRTGKQRERFCPFLSCHDRVTKPVSLHESEMAQAVPLEGHPVN